MKMLKEKLIDKLIAKILGDDDIESTLPKKLDNYFIGKKVIIRTYSAGVHYGELIEKDGGEVILKNSRRLWYWETANKGISLSEVANVGLSNNSKVCSSVELNWLQAIEIIPCTDEAIKNIEAKNEYKA